MRELVDPRRSLPLVIRARVYIAVSILQCSCPLNEKTPGMLLDVYIFLQAIQMFKKFRLLNTFHYFFLTMNYLACLGGSHI